MSRFVVCALIVAMAMVCPAQHASSKTVTNAEIIKVLSELPPCIVACVQEVPLVLLEDPTSLCQNSSLQDALGLCTTSACNNKDEHEIWLFRKKLCASVESHDEYRPVIIHIVGLVSGSLAITAWAARMYHRVGHKQLGWDDLALSAAILPVVGLIVCETINAEFGFGRHIWNINPYHGVAIRKNFFVSEIQYLLATYLIKMSILLFYLRIFVGRHFRVGTIIVIMVNVGATVGTVSAVIVQCEPMRSIWNSDVQGKCANIFTLAYAAAGLNLVLDVTILTLPLPSVRKLQLDRKKKFEVYVVFGFGTIACLTSAVRLGFIIRYGRSTDMTYDYFEVTVWSLAEVSVALICACLPSIRSLIYQRAWYIKFLSKFIKNKPKASTPRTPNSGFTQNRSALPQSANNQLSRNIDGPSKRQSRVLDPDFPTANEYYHMQFDNSNVNSNVRPGCTCALIREAQRNGLGVTLDGGTDSHSEKTPKATYDLIEEEEEHPRATIYVPSSIHRSLAIHTPRFEETRTIRLWSTRKREPSPDVEQGRSGNRNSRVTIVEECTPIPEPQSATIEFASPAGLPADADALTGKSDTSSSDYGDDNHGDGDLEGWYDRYGIVGPDGQRKNLGNDKLDRMLASGMF